MGGFRGASGWERGEGERGLGKSPRDAPLLIHSPRAEKHSSTRRGAHARAVCSRFRVGPVADLLQVFFFFFFPSMQADYKDLIRGLFRCLSSSVSCKVKRLLLLLFF